MLRYLVILIIAFGSYLPIYGQDSTSAILPKIPAKYADKVSARVQDLGQKLDGKSTKALRQLQQQEKKIQQKLSKIDSLATANIFTGANEKYQQLTEKLKSPGKLTKYTPRLDSMVSLLNLLQQHPQLISQAADVKEKVKAAISKVDVFKSQLQKAEDIKKFLKERKQFLKEQLSKFGFAKELKKLNKQVYYYSQQVNEYKEILKDPKKIEKKALELLSKTKLFRDFMKQNSMLAGLFRMPGNEPGSVASLAGLQTRVQVNNLIQTQISAGGPNAQQQFQQNLQAAQSQLSQLKDKVMQFGGSSSEDIMPEGFKPNNQKTKSFWKRLELGTNLQSQKSNGVLPTTSDIGLSVGFKPNDKSLIGIGSSFKVGWGKDIQHLKLSGQGVSLRSFIDYKLKGSFWISGGYEMNYRSEFKNIEALNNYAAWQQSGLIGVSKVVSIKSKLFKKTKLMLLWDMLSYEQVPRTQPVVFRIGYNF